VGRVRVELTLPAAAYPPAAGRLVRWTVRAAAAAGNTAPSAAIDVEAYAGGGGRRPAGASPAERLDAWVGQPLLFSAARSRDAQGERIIAYLWDLGDGRTARGPRVAHTYGSPGRRPVRLTVIDEAGARATSVREVEIRHRPPPGCGGCCAPSGSPLWPAAPALLGLGSRRWPWLRSCVGVAGGARARQPERTAARTVATTGGERRRGGGTAKSDIPPVP